MRGTALWGSGLAAALLAACGLPGMPPIPGGGPPDSPTTVVTATVSATCNGGTIPQDLAFDLTVPTSVRTGRPFPVEVAAHDLPLPDGVAAQAGLSIAGASTTGVNVSMEDPTYLVATDGHRDVTLAISQFSVFDPATLYQSSCVVDASTPVVTIPVRQATPFAHASLTATQRVGVLCLSFPGGRLSSVDVYDVSITVPNQVRAGEPFTITGSDVDIVGGVRSGDTVTPTGAAGDTVEFSYDASYTQTAPPPLPPVVILVCQQQGGPVHLASLPIVP